jgi:hypothetical protein
LRRSHAELGNATQLGARATPRSSVPNSAISCAASGHQHVRPRLLNGPLACGADQPGVPWCWVAIACLHYRSLRSASLSLRPASQCSRRSRSRSPPPWQPWHERRRRRPKGASRNPRKHTLGARQHGKMLISESVARYQCANNLRLHSQTPIGARSEHFVHGPFCSIDVWPVHIRSCGEAHRLLQIAMNRDLRG